MRFLIDMPVSPTLADRLNETGHNAVHASHVGLAGAADDLVIERAASEARIVVTADLDYPRLLALSGADRPTVVLFRGGNYRDDEMRDLLHRAIVGIPDLTETGQFVVVTGQRIRKRMLPLR